MRFIIISLIFASYFILLSPMVSQKKVSQGDLLNCMCKSSHGSLQAFLYQELDKIWLQENKNGLWIFAKHHAFDSLHPVLLYFVFRTYCDYAYEFLGKKDNELPENPNVNLDLNSRLEAFKSLMLFRIKSRIDTDLCCEFGFYPDNSTWIHKEFGEKLKSRVDYLEKWNQKFCFDEEYITFGQVFNSVNRLQYARDKWDKVSPEWIGVCSKSVWRYCLGAWGNTIYFNDVSEALTTKGSGLLEQINERRMSMLEFLLLRIKILAENKQISELGKWYKFLEF
ncbi:MAG: hypothetical protein WCS92_04450 [Candidatus Babeliales bacterium]|jgi:hypothetical protein